MGKVEAFELTKYTRSDYEKWEGDWELIGGRAVAMAPSPMITHQSVCGEIHFLLKELLESYPHCQVLYGIDWIIDEESVVRPDIILICHDEEGEYITKAPKLIFEVLSKKSAKNDRNIKYQIYESEGVEYYIIVDPTFKIAKVYKLKDGRYIKICDASNEKIAFELKDCTFEFDFAKIWRGLKR